MGEVEHVEPHAVDPREGNKLVFVSHVRQLLLEAGDGFIIKIFLPVKRRRAVIGQQFARETRMDSLGKAAPARDPVSTFHTTPDPHTARRPARG